ncbi:MAG: cysteine hydrolase [Chloroflexi bacterium]|nr:cysteine hydrolase [Chloroflexota bacterium]
MVTLKERVDPKNTALLVVDVQNDFCASDGGLGRRVGDMSRIQAIIPDLLNLIAAARENGVAVVFIRTTHDGWTNSDSWLERRKDVSVEEVPICQEGSWGAELYRVEPEPGDKVITKHRYSAFYGTDLDVVLRAKGIKSLLMTGVATNVCVETTARDGFMRDYRIVFVDNCCGTAAAEDQQATLRNIRNHFGVVVTSQEVIEAWGK